MSETYWSLAATLHRHGQKIPALIQVTGLSKNTIYDIVNGKSQSITLETADKILSGLEKLTGMRFTIEDILKRDPIEDTYASIFANARRYDPMEVRSLLSVWTPNEKLEDAKYWEGLSKVSYYQAVYSPTDNLEDSDDIFEDYLETE